MPIEFACGSCGKKLRVKDTAAGKRVRCSGCQTVLQVPGASSGTGSGMGPSGLPTPTASNWYVKTDDGQTYGPVSKEELDSWMVEGRLTAESQILREGADQWQWASDEYPQLATQSKPVAAPASRQDPFALGEAEPSTNPLGIDFNGANAGASPTPGFAIDTSDGGGAPRAASSSVASRRRRKSDPPTWKILTLIGGGMLLIAFVVPWWSMTAKQPDRKMSTFGSDDISKQMKLAKKLLDVMRDNKDWYEDSDVDEKMSDARDDLDDDDKKITVMLWGWETVTGIIAFAFSFLVIGIAIVPLAARQTQRWSWIGAFVVAALGLSVVILSIVWLATCPNKNVSPVLQQGFVVGPLLTLVGGLLTVGAGIADGVTGLTAFTRGSGSPSKHSPLKPTARE